MSSNFYIRSRFEALGHSATILVVSRCLVRLCVLTIAVGSGACLSPTHDSPSSQSTPAPANMVIVNARVWTGTNAAKGTHRAASDVTAIAVRGDRIVAVGADPWIRTYIDSRTIVIDAGERRVIPGITDSHTHIISGGFQLARLKLRDTRDRNEFVQAVAAEAKSKKPGEWVLGGRWSVESWDHPETPHKNWLDPVTGDVPIFLSRMDGHQALVNSAALRLAGIDAAGPADPKGGQIERDPKTGEPTGILKESAMELVIRFIQEPAPVERYETGGLGLGRYVALRRAMRHANSLGITSVHDMCELADLEAFSRADREGALTVRITAYLSVSDWPAHLDKLETYGLNSDWVRLAGFKGYMDGSLGSRTAYMREPYSDATPDTLHPRGYLNAMADPIESFHQLVAGADAKGVQIAVHAIGDEGNHQLLGAYAYALNRNSRRDARHRVEHAQHLLVSDISRFAELGVVASMQPVHKADDGRYAEKAVGGDRLKGSYAFRRLVDAGALLIFGSDWPVVTLNPFAGIDSAVNARTLDGKVWLPSHSLTLEEALYAYTVAPPQAIHREDRLGTIEPGKYADLVILNNDPFSIPKHQLASLKVFKTIVAGKVVYSRNE